MEETKRRKTRRAIETCPVCCEQYTRAVRKPLECSMCQFSACITCYKRYLTESPTPKCMGANCDHEFDREFLDTHFPRIWINGEYKMHRENVLVDMEMARMPTSQHLVTNFRIANALKTTMRLEEEERQNIKQRIREIEINKWNQMARHGRIRESRYNSDGFVGGQDTGIGGSAAARNFVRKCPVDECRGFLSSALKCGVCDTFACKDCLGVVGPTRDFQHVCDPAAVETVRYLRSETRPCPKCHIAISKIDGCDQMFCVYCQTAFSWRTGQISANTRIHNPEYFRWLRERSVTGEIPVDAGANINPCGNDGAVEIGGYELDQHLRRIGASKEDSALIMRRLQNVRHAQMDLDNMANPNVPADHLDLRLKYLLGEFSRDDLKRRLALREKRREKEISIRNLYTILVSVTNENYVDFVRNGNGSAADLLEKMETLLEFIDTGLDSICKRFTCTIYRNWTRA